MTMARIPRRYALASAGAALVAPRLAFGQGSAPAQIASEAERPKADWGAIAGDVTADRAILWSRADRTSRMLVEWATDEGFRNTRRVLDPPPRRRATSRHGWTSRGCRRTPTSSTA